MIELLVGLALLMVAVSLLPGSLRLGFRAISAQTDLDRAANLDLALEQIEQRVARAMPLFERNASGGIRALFQGTSTSLFFVAASSNGPADPGLYRHWLLPRAISPDAERGQGLDLLMDLHEPSQAVPTSPDTPDRHALVPLEQTVRFRYYGAMRQGIAPDWHDGWQRRDALPMLVEITVSSTQGAPQTARRIVVRPRLDVRN